MSQAAIDGGVPEQLGLRSRCCRCAARRTSASATWCATTPRRVIEVDPETYAVTVDGEPARSSRRESLPLTQLFYLV